MRLRFTIVPLLDDLLHFLPHRQRVGSPFFQQMINSNPLRNTTTKEKLFG